MSKYIKMLALTFVTMAFVLPANAKVINLYDMEEYEFFGSKQLKDKKDEAAQKCSSSELSASEKGDLTCTSVRTLKNGVKCYKNCSCSKDLYPYSSEECSGAFEGYSDVCSYGGNVRYKDCKCKSPDYTNISSSDLSKYEKYFNISSAKKEIKKNNKTITCYKIADFTCKSEYSSISGTTSGSGIEVTLTATDEPIRYKVAQAGNKKCVYGVDGLTSSAVYADRPSTDCGETGSKTANKFSYTYYYYTGCSTSGNCIATSTQECVNVSSNSITVFNTSNQSTSSKTCYKVTGCKTGWNGNVFCDTDNSVAAGISRETKGKGTITCMSVSCGPNYTTYASGTGSSSTINTSKTTAQTWHSVGVHQTGSGSSISYLICAKPNCPANSTYNTTSKTCACNTGYMMESDNKCYLGADHCAKENKIYQNGQCVACASGKVFNPTTKTCRDECKANSTWNGTACVCNSGYNKDANGNCIACSGGKTWNGTACVCPAGYNENASGNCVKEDSGECKVCPANSTYSETSKKCLCNIGTYYNDSTGKCLLRQDLSGTEYIEGKLVVGYLNNDTVMVLADLSTAKEYITSTTKLLNLSVGGSASGLLTVEQYDVVKEVVGSSMKDLSNPQHNAGANCFYALGGIMYNLNKGGETQNVTISPNITATEFSKDSVLKDCLSNDRTKLGATTIKTARAVAFDTECEEEVEEDDDCPPGEEKDGFGGCVPITCDDGMELHPETHTCVDPDTCLLITTTCSVTKVPGNTPKRKDCSEYEWGTTLREKCEESTLIGGEWMEVTFCQTPYPIFLCCGTNEKVDVAKEQCVCNDGYTRNSAGECVASGGINCSAPLKNYEKCMLCTASMDINYCMCGSYGKFYHAQTGKCDTSSSNSNGMNDAMKCSDGSANCGGGMNEALDDPVFKL